jgi:CheY-like chemotaxis protein
VIWNLLSNAVRFTPAGGSIEVAVARAGGSLEIVVRDTGPGIDAAFLPHAFERFRQGAAGTTRAHGGLGLGLAIARRLVELHGGYLTADSAGLGRGATFTMQLPLRDPDRTYRTSPQTPGDGAALRGCRVLLVEDDADSREAITIALELEGAAVRAAGSVDVALRLLGDASPDVVVSDLSMPGTDGYGLLAALRARHVRVPAIAVSGFATPEDRQRALEAGFRDHLPKPVDVDLLLRTVARELRLAERETRGDATLRALR